MQFHIVVIIGHIMARTAAVLFIAIILLSPASGCLSANDGGAPKESSLRIDGPLIGGDWSEVTLVSSSDLSVFIPYFVVDPGSKRAQNGTVLDLESGSRENVQWLLPPRNLQPTLLIGELGREEWPVRAANESWQDWIEDPSNGGAVKVTTNGDNGSWRWLEPHDNDGGPVSIKAFETFRPERSTLTIDQGVGASGGWLDGRSVYEWVDFITDETPDLLDPADRAKGYLDRWIGNGNPAYEDSITYFEGVFDGFGLRTEVHRFQSGTLWVANICAYKDGSSFPDEWLVFGAHFDLAPYVTPTSLLPGLEQTGYGTRTGAYDNTAGTAMVLTTAGVLSQFDARRTMVFCLWSSEEEGLWGSEAFVADVPSGVTVSNYLNLDMAGVNFPGNYALSASIGEDADPDSLDQPKMYNLAYWIASDALNLSYQLEMGRQAWSEGGETPLWNEEFVDTVAIYESPTCRSDHCPFQDIGVATLNWNGLADGYPCYHKTCDTLDRMEQYMATGNATGEANLAHSWDIITWWAVYAFLHMDQTPVPNEL